MAARRFASQLQGKFERLAEIGVSGTRRLDLGDDISAIVFRDRIILLKPFDERMHILRVLHGRQNIHDLFSSDD
ncbi:hypothetical protein SAMN05880582_10164 [Rhizobium sp. RU20A]|nr:hypothetical protein SAMN05880582_10164 [Rhizobium sp. RU20A]